MGGPWPDWPPPGHCRFLKNNLNLGKIFCSLTWNIQSLELQSLIQIAITLPGKFASANPRIGFGQSFPMVAICFSFRNRSTSSFNTKMFNILNKLWKLWFYYKSKVLWFISIYKKKKFYIQTNTKKMVMKIITLYYLNSSLNNLNCAILD